MKHGKLSDLGSMMAHFQLGRFAQSVPVVPAPDPNAASLARAAGRQGASAPPMDNARRAENYRRRRGGLAPTLTDRQRRRLRKARNLRDGVETGVTA